MASEPLKTIVVSFEEQPQPELPAVPDLAALCQATTSLGSFGLRWLLVNEERKLADRSESPS